MPQPGNQAPHEPCPSWSEEQKIRAAAAVNTGSFQEWEMQQAFHELFIISAAVLAGICHFGARR